MKLIDYIKDKMVVLLFDFFLLFAVGMLFYLIDVGSMVAVFFGAIFMACLVVPLIIDFWKRKHFYDEFSSNLEALEEKNLIMEVVKRPDFSEGRILYDSLKICNKAMLEKIKEHSRAQTEYREYVEMWVHEVKTPIASSRLILENHPEVPRGLVQDMDTLENLVEQVLFYARSNVVEKDYMIRKTNLKKIVNNVVRRNAKEFIEKKIRVNVAIEDIVVNTDAKWIEFILHQIIGNSLKYADKKDSYVIISQRREINAVMLDISDNGIGMPSSEIQNVFKKGFTGSNGRKYERSTGLGLYLCAKLCEKLGHGLKMDSCEGKGTTMTIIFPENSMVEV